MGQTLTKKRHACIMMGYALRLSNNTRWNNYWHMAKGGSTGTLL